MATSVLLLLASTRTSSPLLASTRFSPVCYSSTRILASRIYSHTRIYWYWWGRKLPYMCFSLLPDLVRSWLLLASTHTSCCYSRLLAGLRHYSRVLDLVRSLLLLASTRILASTGIGGDARCRSCVFPCYSHTLACLRRYSHLLDLVRYSHLLACLLACLRVHSIQAGFSRAVTP